MTNSNTKLPPLSSIGDMSSKEEEEEPSKDKDDEPKEKDKEPEKHILNPNYAIYNYIISQDKCQAFFFK